MGIFSWLKTQWRKPLPRYKPAPKERGFKVGDTSFYTGISQNKNIGEESMPKVTVSSKVSPAIPAKRKRKARKLTPQQVPEVQAKVKDAEGKPAEPKPAQPQKPAPLGVTRQERAAQAVGASVYPATRNEKAIIMRQRQPISKMRPMRITPPRPRIGR